MAKPFLLWTAESGQQQKHVIDRDELLIGRLSESDLVFTNPYISRKHAKICRQGSTFSIQDMKSTHGTFVNGVRVSQKPLSHGDRITLGRDQVELRFSSDEPGAGTIAPGLGASDLEKSVMQLTSVIPLADTESSHLEKISHILDFQYQWEKSFSPESTFRQILEAALKLSGAERGYILLKEDPGFKYVLGLNGDGLQLSENEFRHSETVVQNVLEGGEPVLMTENIDQAYAQQQSILAMDLRAVACVPLRWFSDRSEQQVETRGILYLDSTKTMHALTGLDQKILNKLAVEAANVFEKLELIDAFEQKKAFEKELALARETQTTLLPAELPEVPGFALEAFSEPTRHVGGDFYDFLLDHSEGLTGVLADVSGKGISAALLSSLVQGALQVEFRSGTSISETVELLNAYLCEKSQANRFVTMVIFRIGPDGKGEFLSAGHNPSYLYRDQTCEVEALNAEGLIVGAFSFATYSAQRLEMFPGDILVIYSDGITEAINREDEMFGEEKLIELIRQNASKGCRALERIILKSIEEFTEGMEATDDMTMVIVQRL